MLENITKYFNTKDKSSFGNAHRIVMTKDGHKNEECVGPAFQLLRKPFFLSQTYLS